MVQAVQALMLDETLSKEVIAAVCSAMQNTFDVEVTPGEYEIGEGMVSLVGDVSGVIAMVQNHLEGTLILCLTYDSIREILPHVIGNSIAVTSEMALDAVGELTNMIFGQIKTELNKRGYQIKLGIPSVVMGRGHFVSQFHRGKYMIIPFTMGGNLFQVNVAIYTS